MASGSRRLRIAILGSTGSIGTQTLDIVSEFPDRFEVVGLAAHSRRNLIREQAARFKVPHIALFEDPTGEFPSGIEAIEDMASHPDVDLVVVSVAGMIGLRPTLAAIRAGKNIALASKEVLVGAGEVVMPLLIKHGCSMTPIDSEHSAVFQCLHGYRPDQVHKIILTASGGPFRGWTKSQLESVTVEQALAHPTWRMGGKITIDSATLMNKALEMIEARWLFGVPMAQVEAVIHPQSIVHSLVQFLDGSVLGQLGWPNMRSPILYALTCPERWKNTLPMWNPIDSPSLTFEPVDEETFPALRIARAAMEKGGTTPCAFNAANEEAANGFIKGKVGFLDIARCVEEVTNGHDPEAVTVESLLRIDCSARIEANRIMALMRQ